MFTFIFILFSIVSYHFKEVLIGYFISFIHEIGHILCARFFSLKKFQIEFLPVGFYAYIEDVESLPSYKQILIFLSGPMMFFPLYIFGCFFLEMKLFSSYEYDVFNYVNKSILLFNLMLFYPLDGGRIIDVLLASYIDEKIVLRIRIIINFICLIVFIFIQGLKKNILISIMLFICLILQMINQKKDYKNFLIKRMIFKGNKKKKISSKCILIRSRDNYFMKKGKIYNDNYIVKQKLLELSSPRKK